MSVIISNDGGIQVPIDADEIIQVIQAVLSAEAVERECSVSVSIVDEDEIQSLNAMWRQIDAPTDVLSFECDSPFGDEVPDGEVVELGDVILCPAVIAAQAPDFNTTPADEFRLMLVHGMLHLLGYDHIDSDDAARMEDRELVILRGLAQVRGIDPQSIVIGPTTSHLDD